MSPPLRHSKITHHFLRIKGNISRLIFRNKFKLKYIIRHIYIYIYIYIYIHTNIGETYMGCVYTLANESAVIVNSKIDVNDPG